MKRKSIRANNDRLLVVTRIIDRSFDIPPICVQVLVHILPFSQLRFRRPQGPLLNRPLPSGSNFFFLNWKKVVNFYSGWLYLLTSLLDKIFFWKNISALSPWQLECVRYGHQLYNNLVQRDWFSSTTNHSPIT